MAMIKLLTNFIFYRSKRSHKQRVHSTNKSSDFALEVSFSIDVYCAGPYSGASKRLCVERTMFTFRLLLLNCLGTFCLQRTTNINFNKSNINNATMLILYCK